MCQTVEIPQDNQQVFVMSTATRDRIFVQVAAITILTLLIFDGFVVAEKGRDIIIYNGKVIVKSGKKKGNIIISNGEHGNHKQGGYKYKKKYMNYGGFW